MRRRHFFPLLGLIFIASPGAAQRLYRLEVSGAAGLHGYDNKLELRSSLGGALRLGYWITGPLSVEVEGTVAGPKTNNNLRKTVSTSTISGWVLGNFTVNRSLIVLAKAGYGSVSFGSCPTVSVPGAGPCGSAGVLEGGLGVRIPLGQTVLMRYDAVLARSQTSLKFSNATLQGGVSIMIGSKPLVDSDGDGVWDRYDKCPDTRLGALTNKQGCPTDQDADGVPDGLDRCPNTLTGATVDQAGCSQDSDGDGYLDGIDACPGTPPGALVDRTGCPSDSDQDGVLDGLDRCDDTPPGATVDQLGCPGDQDADGVFDGLDRCPDTRVGVAVDTYGCPLAPEPTPADSLNGPRDFVLPGEVWRLRQSDLAPSSAVVLDSLVQVLNSHPASTVEINAFAYDGLIPADNTRLSQRRADAVKAYLVERGISVERITAVGRGSEPLLAEGTSDEVRTLNRRVEIHVTP